MVDQTKNASRLSAWPRAPERIEGQQSKILVQIFRFISKLLYNNCYHLSERYAIGCAKRRLLRRRRFIDAIELINERHGHCLLACKSAANNSRCVFPRKHRLRSDEKARGDQRSLHCCLCSLASRRLGTQSHYVENSAADFSSVRQSLPSDRASNCPFRFQPGQGTWCPRRRLFQCPNDRRDRRVQVQSHASESEFGHST